MVNEASDVSVQKTLSDGLKSAMRRMPGAVSLITTSEPDGLSPAGMAVSAVISVSMEPPSMLIAINQSASSIELLRRRGRFCVNLLSTAQTEMVRLFSNSEARERRFASQDWQYLDGIPYLADACASIFCDVRHMLAFGTHELFVGEVYDILTTSADQTEPLGWLGGGFARLSAL